MLRRASTFRCKKLDETEVGGIEKQMKKTIFRHIIFKWWFKWTTVI